MATVTTEIEMTAQEMAVAERDIAQRQTELFKTIAHPLRITLLRITRRGKTSPVKLATALDESVQLVAYHVRILRDRGFVKNAGTEPRRGALEHFYEITPRGQAALDILETFETGGITPNVEALIRAGNDLVECADQNWDREHKDRTIGTWEMAVMKVYGREAA